MVVLRQRERLQNAQQTFVQYKITAAHIDEQENFGYTTYGISALDQYGRVIAEVLDVSPKKELVADLVARCNQGGLHPMHLRDVAEDFLP